MTPDLAPDCGRCAALCCILLAFDAGPDFAHDKPAGAPCRNLAGHRCRQHARLSDAGYPGCARYDCRGAGQIVVQQIFAGRSWRDDPALVAPMSEAFRVLRQVQDLRAQLGAAQGLPLTPAQRRSAKAQADRLSGDWSRLRLDRFDLTAAQRDFTAFALGLRAVAAPT